MMVFLGLCFDRPIASVMNGLYDIGGLAPSIPQDAVRIATGFEASIRCARDAAANPPNTTAWIAPSRDMASVPIRAAGIIGTVSCQRPQLCEYVVLTVN